MTTESLPPLALHRATRTSPGFRATRAVPFLLALVGAVAFVFAFKLPWWKFILYAPQYPHGFR